MDDITRSRTSWLAANMGCCASKQDVVDDMRVNGEFDSILLLSDVMSLHSHLDMFVVLRCSRHILSPFKHHRRCDLHQLVVGMHMQFVYPPLNLGIPTLHSITIRHASNLPNRHSANTLRPTRTNGTTAPVSDSQICYEQPQTVPQPLAEPMHHRPSTSHSVSRHVSQWVSNSREYANSSRASISTLTRPRRSHSRPSISRPTDFRHFDGLDGIQSMVDEAPMPVRRRRSFRPLELSIYLPNGCGRLSPLPDFDVEECWESMPAGLELPPEAVVRVRDSRTASLSSNPSTSSYLIQRKPVSTLSRRSSVQSQKSTSTHERHLSGTTMATMATPTLSFLPEEPQSSSASLIEKPTMQRSRTSGTLSPARVLSRLPSPSRNRANTAPSRPSSLRRVRTDVDDAIRELNTIVEERRASAYRSNTQVPALTNRPPPSPSHHVPYIAPSMRMHVRSETLSDIGSAFSAPLANSTLSTPPTTGNAAARRATTALTLFPPPSRTYTGPLTSNPITPPAPVTPTTPITRLGAWLKRSTSDRKSVV